MGTRQAGLTSKRLLISHPEEPFSQKAGTPMRRWSYFLYGIFCYLLFFATFAYMFGFVGNWLVPKTIDTATTDSPLKAVLIDLVLLLMFALQHSVMARPGFKSVWTRLVPSAIERSTYILIACLVLIVLMWQWRAIDTVIWNVAHPVGRWVLWALFATGWLLVPAVSLMISHTDLFGIRQVWLHVQGRPYTPLAFRTPMLYRHLRHPMYVGWAISFWAIPTMTLGHLLFAGTLTLYMFLAALIEERDLVAHFGDTYRAYQKRVPMFRPRLHLVVKSPAEPSEVHV